MASERPYSVFESDQYIALQQLLFREPGDGALCVAVCDDWDLKFADGELSLGAFLTVEPHPSCDRPAGLDFTLASDYFEGFVTQVPDTRHGPHCAQQSRIVLKPGRPAYVMHGASL